MTSKIRLTSSSFTEQICLNKKPVKFDVKNDKKFEIVGVVKDFHVNGPQDPIAPMVFFHYKTIDWSIANMNTFFIKSSPEKMEQTIASLEKLWKTKVDPENPFVYDFVDKAFARTYQSYVSQKNLFSLY